MLFALVLPKFKDQPDPFFAFPQNDTQNGMYNHPIAMKVRGGREDAS